MPPNLISEIWLNMGEIKSRGLEFTLNYPLISKSDFSYNISFCSSLNSANTLVSLSGSYNGYPVNNLYTSIGFLGTRVRSSSEVINVEEGQPIGQFKLYTFKEIDENGSLVLVDTDNNGDVNYYDREVAGNGLPKFLLGFGNNFTYKNWDLNIFFRGVFGHDLINSYRAINEYPNLIGFYNLPASATEVRNSTNGKLMTNTWNQPSSYHLENASFVALDNICLGYNFNLPDNSSFSKVRLYLAGNNLFYINNYRGPDPNPRYTDPNSYTYTYGNPLAPGIDRTETWPRTRSVSFGANFVF